MVSIGQRVVADCAAGGDTSRPATDLLHHPAAPRSALFARGYIAARSGHSRGSTVDLTLIPAGPRRAAARRATAGRPAAARWRPQAAGARRRWRRTAASIWGRRSTASTSARTRG
jgi:D-alanyl-D-alanine dipeptidase